MSTGPLEEAPKNFRPPFDQYPRQQPYDPDTERWRENRIAARVAAIEAALDGVELGAYDRRMIDWLAGLDEPTIGTVVSWLTRVREASR
jgi:hypothetical protein